MCRLRASGAARAGDALPAHRKARARRIPALGRLASGSFGEGLSGLASGNASLITGMPGSVVIYGVLALAAWPRRGRSDVPPARWLPHAWAVFWIGAAVLQALPMNNTGADVSSAILAFGGPSWLASFQASLAGWVSHHGLAAVAVLVAVEALIGLAALSRRTVALSAAVGLLAILAI